MPKGVEPIVRRADFGDVPAPLPAGVVEVWHCPTAAVFGRGPITLTADELARAERYRHTAAREQFAACRTALRVILGGVLGLPPLDVPIAVGPDGKPFLPPSPDRPAVEFNVSHTAGFALVAVGGVPVGVDVEVNRVVANAAGLVGRYFRPEEQAEFAALPDGVKAAAFLRGWTCKEAVLKGIGCGVRDLDRCQVRLDPRCRPAVLAPADTAAGWQLVIWEPAAGFVAALAVRTTERPAEDIRRPLAGAAEQGG